jgi:hypothetical protein
MKTLLFSLFITGLFFAVSPSSINAASLPAKHNKNVELKRVRVLLSFKVANGAGFQYNALYALSNATTGTYGIPLNDGITTQVSAQEGDVIELRGYQIGYRQIVVTAALIATGGTIL